MAGSNLEEPCRNRQLSSQQLLQLLNVCLPETAVVVNPIGSSTVKVTQNNERRVLDVPASVPPSVPPRHMLSVKVISPKRRSTRFIILTDLIKLPVKRLKESIFNPLTF